MHMAVDEAGDKVSPLSIHDLMSFQLRKAEYPASAYTDRAFTHLAAEHVHDAHIVDAQFGRRTARDHIKIRSFHRVLHQYGAVR